MLQKIHSRPLFALCCAIFCSLPFMAGDAGYHTQAELGNTIEDLSKRYPTLVRHETLGTTLAGNPIYAITLGAGEDLTTRPALLIAANLEGHQVYGSELALSIVTDLAERYGTDEEVKKALDGHTIYVIARVNPDGAADLFADVKTERRSNLSPYDDDNDGRIDEDGPEDLNGDGLITLMRKEDPEGRYIPHPKDKRLLVKADANKGEKGQYKLYSEGRDNDGDGFYNEDWQGGTDPNRNFQHAYPYYRFSAGPHMVSERETRAVMDFLVTHRNIAMMLTFGESDNLVSAVTAKGKMAPAKGSGLSPWNFVGASVAEARKVGVFKNPRNRRFRGFGRGQQETKPRRPGGRKPAVVVHKKDIPFFTQISEKYVEITGITKAAPVREAKGSLFDYGYFQYGVPSFSTPGWGLENKKKKEKPAGDETKKAETPEKGAEKKGKKGPRSMGGKGKKDKGSLDLDLLNYMKREKVDGFVDWKPFTHPELGQVEIGGFKPYATSGPAAGQMPELASKHSQFTLYLTSLLPRVRFAKHEVKSHGGGIYQIEAVVENQGILPTALQQGVTSRAVRPTMVQLEVAPEAIISGDIKTSFFQALEGSGARKKFQWIFSGKKGQKVTVKLQSQKAGSETLSLTLP